MGAVGFRCCSYSRSRHLTTSANSANVDAFCVEHGRWTSQREGRPTDGKFGALSQLVTSNIRAAAQYKNNQSEVWSNVDATNAAHGKAAPSHTLMATIDDPEVVVRRDALAGRVNAYLQSSAARDGIVGLAYAVDGKVRAVRWFSSHGVFELARPALTNTAAVDALTARAAQQPSANGPTPAAQASDVVAFVRDVENEQVREERDTHAGNKNEYRESGHAYGSRTILKSVRASAAAGTVPLSSDFIAK